MIEEETSVKCLSVLTPSNGFTGKYAPIEPFKVSIFSTLGLAHIPSSYTQLMFLNSHHRWPILVFFKFNNIHHIKWKLRISVAIFLINLLNFKVKTWNRFKIFNLIYFYQRRNWRKYFDLAYTFFCSIHQFKDITRNTEFLIHLFLIELITFRSEVFWF